MKVYQLMSFDTETDFFKSSEGTDLEKVLKEGYNIYLQFLREYEEVLESDHSENDLSEERFRNELLNRGRSVHIQCYNSRIEFELLEFTLPDIEIPLQEGLSLVAEINTEPGYNEIFIGLRKDGIWLQDLAIVGEGVMIKDDFQKLPVRDKYSVKIYADCNNEDFTHEFIIDRFKDEGES